MTMDARSPMLLAFQIRIFEFNMRYFGFLGIVSIISGFSFIINLEKRNEKLSGHFFWAKILFLKNKKISGQEFLKKNQEQKRAQ